MMYLLRHAETQWNSEWRKQGLNDSPLTDRGQWQARTCDPGHPIACRQMSGGFGGMLSILVPGGREEAIAMICQAQVFKRATSLGGVESVLEHRKTSEGEITLTLQRT